MIAVRLEKELEDRLLKLARKTGRTKSYYIRKALNQFLEEREDYLLGLAVLEQNEEYLPISKVRKELGLDN
jgi:RHH-type transcriptional regulator, rel operon repressor / antitoxin RelB